MPHRPNSKLKTQNSKPIHISSRDNSLLRHTRAVRDGKIDDSIYVEGVRLCEEALRAGLQIEMVIYSEKLAQKNRGGKLIEKLKSVASQGASVSGELIE